MKTKYILIAVLAFLAVSCHKDDRGRRSSSDDPSRDEPSSAFVENPAWTITYTGREAMMEDDFTYVVDVLHVTSTDSKTWYLDIVSANDMMTKYRGDMEAFIAESLVSAKEGGAVDVSEGGADIVFDILDEGGGNWVAIAYGCDAKGNLSGEYSRLDFTTQALELKKTDNFKMEYKGRSTIKENGKDVDIDTFSIKSELPYSYYVYIGYPEYIEDNFDGDYAAFFNSVVDEVYDGLADGDDFASAIYSVQDLEIQFDRLRSGNWTLYAIGLDAAGNFLGYWSEYAFTIAEEKPTDEFNRWLGVWTIGDGRVSFEISVKNSESNVAYLVSGWETGDCFDSDNNKNEYTSDFSFETRFDKETGEMVFYVQYIGFPYEWNNETYDLYLLGVYGSADNQYLYEFESDIARAKLDGETSATVTALSCDKGKFTSMRYADLSRDASNTDAYIYAARVPYFPMTMTWESSEMRDKAADKAVRRTSRPRTGASSSARVSPVRSEKGQTFRGAACSSPFRKAASSTSGKTTKAPAKSLNAALSFSGQSER